MQKDLRIDKSDSDHYGKQLLLHAHQTEAIKKSKEGKSYVLTSGTGSGKSLTYIVPIVDHVLRRGSGQGVQAVVVFPMNALANSESAFIEPDAFHSCCLVQWKVYNTTLTVMSPSELVAAVRAWQANQRVHPLTCRNDSRHRPLEPVEDVSGVVLVCQDCDYRQTYIPPSIQRAFLSGLLSH